MSETPSDWILRRYWRNGGRLNLILVVLLVVVIVLTIPAFVGALQGDPAPALEFDTPYALADTTVQQGESIHANQQVCNNLDERIDLITTASWVSLDDGTVHEGPSTRLSYEPGCTVQDVEIPTTVFGGRPLPAGTWIRSGTIMFLSPEGLAPVGFQSEPFEVVTDG